MLDAGHPFFRRAWVRWATCAVPAAWAIFEAMSGAWIWAALFAGLSVWAFVVLILRRRDG